MAKEETLGSLPNGLGRLPGGARGHLRVAVIVAYSVCPFCHYSVGRGRGVGREQIVSRRSTHVCAHINQLQRSEASKQKKTVKPARGVAAANSPSRCVVCVSVCVRVRERERIVHRPL